MTIKATYDRGVFIPEKKPRIRNGQTVYLEFKRIPAEAEIENPSPSGDPYFLVPENLQKIDRAVEQMRRGEGRVYTLEQLRTMMGL